MERDEDPWAHLDAAPAYDFNDMGLTQGSAAIRSTLAKADTAVARLFQLDDAADWEGQTVPPRRWLLDGWLPVGEAGLFTGPGSVGKSLMSQQLAATIAAGGSFMGVPVEQATTIYITCEDSTEELQRRQRSIAQTLGSTLQRGRFMLKSWKGELDLELFGYGEDRRLVPTPRYDMLRATALAAGARLIVLDNISHLFGGDENTKREVAAFVNLMNGLAADIDGVVLLLGHPNKTGLNKPGEGDANQFGGSVAWENQVRSRLYLATTGGDDPDARVLTNPKANYTGKGGALEFRWHDGAFIRDSDLPDDRRAELASIIQANHDNTLFLTCLATATEARRAVSHMKGSNYAPSVFAAMPEAKGVKAPAFAMAMERLIHLRTIKLDEPLWQGQNRHWKQGIKLASECANPPALTPCADPRQPPSQVVDIVAPTLRAPTPLYTTYNGAAPLGSAAPSQDTKPADLTRPVFAETDPADSVFGDDR